MSERADESQDHGTISWDVAGTTTPLVPIIDLGTGFYGAYQGGLYAGGSNEDDPNHHAYGMNEAAAVQPLDSNGNPSGTGKYALLTIGNSNASTISGEFVTLASSDPARNESLVVVNGVRAALALMHCRIPEVIFGASSPTTTCLMPE